MMVNSKIRLRSVTNLVTKDNNKQFGDKVDLMQQYGVTEKWKDTH